MEAPGPAAALPPQPGNEAPPLAEASPAGAARGAEDGRLRPGAKRVTFPSDEDIVSGAVEPKDPWRHGLSKHPDPTEPPELGEQRPLYRPAPGSVRQPFFPQNPASVAINYSCLEFLLAGLRDCLSAASPGSMSALNYNALRPDLPPRSSPAAAACRPPTSAHRGAAPSLTRTTRKFTLLFPSLFSDKPLT